MMRLAPRTGTVRYCNELYNITFSSGALAPGPLYFGKIPDSLRSSSCCLSPIVWPYPALRFEGTGYRTSTVQYSSKSLAETSSCYVAYGLMVHSTIKPCRMSIRVLQGMGRTLFNFIFEIQKQILRFEPTTLP